MTTDRRLGLMAATLLAVVMFGAACAFVSVTPETATNEVGTTHTVTATLAIDVCEFVQLPFCEVTQQAIGENITFEVIEGPNAGEQSDGDCGPDSNDLCIIEFPGESVSWTYRGDGGAGIDYIQVCLVEPQIESLLAAVSQETGLTEDEARALLLVKGQSEHDIEINEPEPEEGCDIVSKVWVEPTPTPTPTATSTPQVREISERSVPNIGAGLSGLFAGQPTALPTAIAPATAAAAPGQTIRPPSTGEAGLR